MEATNLSAKEISAINNGRDTQWTKVVKAGVKSDDGFCYTVSGDNNAARTMYYYVSTDESSQNNGTRLVFAGGTGGYPPNAGPGAVANHLMEGDTMWSSANVYSSTESAKDTYSVADKVNNYEGVEQPKADYTLYALESASAAQGTPELLNDKGHYDIAFVESGAGGDDATKFFNNNPEVYEHVKENGAIYAIEASGTHFDGGISSSAARAIDNFGDMANGGAQVYFITNPNYSEHSLTSTDNPDAPAAMFANGDMEKIVLGTSGPSLEGYQFYDLSSLADPSKGEKLVYEKSGDNVTAIRVVGGEEEKVYNVQFASDGKTMLDITDKDGNSIQVSPEEMKNNGFAKFMAETGFSQDVYEQNVNIVSAARESGQFTSKDYAPSPNPGGVEFDMQMAINNLEIIDKMMAELDAQRAQLGKVDFDKVKNVDEVSCPSCMENIV